MSILNNVNLDAFNKTIEKAKSDPASRVVKMHIEGDWNVKGEGVQFKGDIKTPKTQFTIECDEPEFLGGGGDAPSPIHYCILGGAACYAASFAKWAAMEGIKLKELKINADGVLDLGRSMGISDEPVVKEMKWELNVKSDAPDEELKRAKKLADERCPALNCYKNSIDVSTYLKKTE